MITPEEIKDPSSIPENFTPIGKAMNSNRPNNDYLFFTHKKILIILSGNYTRDYKTNEQKYISYQACFPLEALSWAMKMLDYFFTPPKDGGLPAGKIATTEIIAGENLQFNRGMCVGGPDHGGYTLTNLSRVDYGEAPNSKSFQEFDFPDPWLFDGGLMEFWKDLADRYERGEFN